MRAYLHLSPPRWHHLVVVHLDLAGRHLVQTLLDDVQALPHLLHPHEIPDNQAKYDQHRQDAQDNAQLQQRMRHNIKDAIYLNNQNITIDFIFEKCKQYPP